MFKNKKLANKKITLVALTLVIIAIGVGSYFAFFKNDHKNTPTQGTPDIKTANQDIDMSPATETEKAESQQAKNGNTQSSPNAVKTNPSTGKKQVNPVITYANKDGQNVTVNSYVGSIVEEGGTCTAEFTKAGTRFAVQSKGFANVSNTNCEPFFVDASRFSNGTWSVVVSYSSASSGGSSGAKGFNVN